MEDRNHKGGCELKQEQSRWRSRGDNQAYRENWYIDISIRLT